MFSPKLIRLLQPLNGHQWNRLERFVASPYFNDKEELCSLLALLRASLQQSSSLKRLDKHYVWNGLFPEDTYNDLQLRRMSSDLIQLIYAFLSLEARGESPLAVNNDLLKVLIEHRAWKKHFAGMVKKQEGILARRQRMSADLQYEAFRFRRLHHRFEESTRPKQVGLDNLVDSDARLDRFYILEKLRNYADLVGYRSFYAKRAELHFPEALEAFIAGHEALEQPLPRAYWLVVQMLTRGREGDTYFQQLRELIQEKRAHFPLKDLRTLYVHLYNYLVILKINPGESAGYKKLFELYQFALDGEILFVGGKLQFQTYKNIVSTALHVKAFDWVEAFIQAYTPCLPQVHQKNALTYNLAKLHFHRGEYGQVIDQLRQVEYEDVVYALGSRLMLLKTYYELDEHLSLDSLLDSFRIYLRRSSKVARETRRQYQNLIRFVKRLIALPPGKSRKLDALAVEVQDCKALAAKDWLLEKLREWDPGLALAPVPEEGTEAQG